MLQRVYHREQPCKGFAESRSACGLFVLTRCVIMNSVMQGWFSEVSSDFPGQAFSLQINEVLFEGKSEFQDILIFKSATFGRVLVLDGRIQLTEKDEAFYQEMIAHIPLSVHPNPRRVLIIGGGDGGVAREVIRHQCVEHVDLVEIDDMVLKLSRKYLPFTASSLDHPKVSVHVADGFAFLKEHAAKGEKYDVIITDSTDPGGPSTPLFNKEYFQLLSQALTDDGIICNQGECLFLDLSTIKGMAGFCRDVFPNVRYAYNIIPTYTCGHIGYIIACKNANIDLCEAGREPPVDCKFYTKAVHRAAFALPKCYEDALRPFLNA
ncbi:Spermidine synthase [Echinococcus granulosus]|nr:Spermidine synthase [Echinococcus granulosus]